MNGLEEQFKNMYSLTRDERVSLIRKLELFKPDFMKPFYPIWWWWKRCQVKVLVVTDGGLDFGTGGFGLSEFLTAFNHLQATTWNDYQITLGHRQSSVANTNPLVVDQISNFNFSTSVNLGDFDQVWLFGINSGNGLAAPELAAVENFMNGGGGLFATGDHGSLGSALCSNITRVKDMRHWNDTSASDDTNEVSMGGKRRNDTNRPRLGDATSLHFDNQSDNIPQTIAVRTFGGGRPHPLLSISTSMRGSGVIDIMPDHPHEGECRQETSFTANGVDVATQVIATSFVLGGSTTAGGEVGGKSLTDPHCFPSIAVWDGRLANAGRIVIDSTWHHFVNINLNGAGSAGSGLTSSDFAVIRQYYMNTSLWISRRKSWRCWRKFIWFDLLKNSQLIEASLNNPLADRGEISLADLSSIGSLAEEVLSGKLNPSIAREFLLDTLDSANPQLSSLFDAGKQHGVNANQGYYHPWFNFDLILHTAIGAGFIALRDDKTISGREFSEKDLETVPDVFAKGLEFGVQKSLENLNVEIKRFSDLVPLR